MYLDRYFNPTISLTIIPKPERFEEDGQPDDQLITSEHAEPAQQQRNETGPLARRPTREPSVVVDALSAYHLRTVGPLFYYELRLSPTSHSPQDHYLFGN